MYIAKFEKHIDQNKLDMYNILYKDYSTKEIQELYQIMAVAQAKKDYILRNVHIIDKLLFFISLFMSFMGILLTNFADGVITLDRDFVLFLLLLFYIAAAVIFTILLGNHNNNIVYKLDIIISVCKDIIKKWNKKHFNKRTTYFNL